MKHGCPMSAPSKGGSISCTCHIRLEARVGQKDEDCHPLGRKSDADEGARLVDHQVCSPLNAHSLRQVKMPPGS